MPISIHQRLRPFSHRPGTQLLIPRSRLAMQVFPSRWFLEDLIEGKRVGEVQLAIQGPVMRFTVQQDLERGIVVIEGEEKRGFFRFFLWPEEKSLIVFVDRGGEDRLRVVSGAIVVRVREKGTPLGLPPLLPLNRLSLGCHKKLDWDLVVRRGDCKEVLPIWHRLGQMTPKSPLPEKKVERLLHNVSAAHKEDTVQEWGKVFQAGFSSLLYPGLVDRFYQGILSDEEVVGSPLGVLSEGARKIESMFLQKEGRETFVLPFLPPDFLCGRFIHTEGLALEWTKKQIRQMTFSPSISGDVVFHFPKSVRSFRVRKGKKGRGEEKTSPYSLVFPAGEFYHFDRFVK